MIKKWPKVSVCFLKQSKSLNILFLGDLNACRHPENIRNIVSMSNRHIMLVVTFEIKD